MRRWPKHGRARARRLAARKRASLGNATWQMQRAARAMVDLNESTKAAADAIDEFVKEQEETT